jgi:hypothetical protein
MFDRFETMATAMRRPSLFVEAALLPPPGQLAPGWSTKPPKKLRLEWKKAEQHIETHALKSWTVLGRDALSSHHAQACHIHLAHPSSSRRHAAIGHHLNGRCYIVDLGSSHGTTVDGNICKPNRPVCGAHPQHDCRVSHLWCRPERERELTPAGRGAAPSLGRLNAAVRGLKV